jgi:hypothetical protein
MSIATPTTAPPVAAFDRSIHFSRSELMQRGWSHSSMRLFLGPPDFCGLRSFYLRSRVIEAEASPLWQSWRWASPKRRLEIEIECE